MPTKFFGTVRQKIFDENLWYPLLCIKFFDTPNFLKHWRNAHEIFRHCETKNFRRKIVIPPILHKIFRYPKFSETLKGCPRNFFGTVRLKIFDGKTWYPLVCIKFFDTPNFLKHWRDAHEIFRHCETKNFRRKIVIPPIMHKIFRYPKFSETLKGCPRNFFGTVRQKIFDGKTWYPLVCIKFFDTPNFLKHWRDAHEIFRHCETKIFRLKIVICPLLSINFFRYQKTSGKQKGSFTKLFLSVLWDKKFRQDRDAPPPPMHENFW